MSVLEDRLRDTLEAHRSNAPATDLTWQAIRTDGRQRRSNRRLVRFGGALAAAMLVITAVVTVRVLRPDETAQDAPVVDSGPSAPAMDASQRRLLQANLEFGHQLALEGLLSTTWMSERRPNITDRFSPPSLPASGTSIVTKAQIDQQRQTTDRARRAFEEAVASPSGRPPEPRDPSTDPLRVIQPRLEGLETNRISVDNFQTDPPNVLDQYAVMVDALRDLSGAISRAQPSASLSLDVEKVATQQQIEADTLLQASVALMLAISPVLPPPTDAFPLLQKLRAANAAIDRDRNALQDLIDPTLPPGPDREPRATAYTGSVQAITISASNPGLNAATVTTPPQILTQATGELTDLYLGAVRFLNQIGSVPRTQFLPDDDAMNAVRVDLETAHQLAIESILSTARSADPSLVSVEQLDRQRRDTDAAIERWRAVVPPLTAKARSVTSDVAAQRLANLATVRRAVDERQAQPVDTVEQYRLTEVAVLDTSKLAAHATRSAPLVWTLVVATLMAQLEAAEAVDAALFPAYAALDQDPKGPLWDRLIQASDDSARAGQTYDEAASSEQRQIRRDTFRDGGFYDLADRLFKGGTDGLRPSTTGVTAAAILPLGLAQVDVLHDAARRVLDGGGAPSATSGATNAPPSSRATTTTVPLPVQPSSTPTVPAATEPPITNASVTVLTQPVPRESSTAPSSTSSSSTTSSTRG